MVVQQYYLHCHYPTPPMLQCSTMLLCSMAQCLPMQESCQVCAGYVAVQYMWRCCTTLGQPRSMLHQSSAWPGYLSRFVNIRVFPSIFDAILCVIVESELNKRSNKNEINTLHGTILHRYNVKWLWCFTVPLHRSHNRRIFTLSFNVGNINDSNSIS